MNARSADLQPLPLIAPRRAGDVFAVDIGATFIRLARFDEQGRCAAPILSATTPSYLSQPRDGSEAIRAALFDVLRSQGRDLFRTEDPASVVVGYPGSVTTEGVARRSPALFGPNSDRQDDIRSALSVLWPRSHVQVINQLTCAGYHYVQRGQKDFCIVHVDGASVSTRVFLDGKPCVGSNGGAGEIGHLKASFQPGTPIGDGMHRELGQVASGGGNVWLARAWERGETTEIATATDTLIAAFRYGDVQARHVVRAAAHPLAMAMSALHLAIGLPKFFVLGEFAKALGPAYRAMLSSWCRELSGSVGQNWDRMIELGEDSAEEGLSGAAYLSTLR